MVDSTRWPFVKAVREWAVMPQDRRRKQFPYRVAIMWPDASQVRLGDALQKWIEFCSDTFGPGTRETGSYLKKKWRWTLFTTHTRTEQLSYVIFAFRTEEDLLVFKMGVMHE